MHVGPSGQVTVIVPVYKTERCLPACLDSLFAQTYPDFEIIVVDDCSPQNCREVVCDYQKSSDRLRYVRHERNRGLLCARLTGVKRSMSKYVAFLDSDDTARQNFLVTLVTTAEATGADIVGSANLERDKDEFIIDGPAEIASALCTRRIPNHNVWTKLFKLSLFEASPELMLFGENEHIVCVEDVAITLTLCTKATRFAQVGQILVDYNRNRLDSSWNSMDAVSILKNIHEIAIVHTYIKGLSEEGDLLIERILRYFYNKKLLNADVHTTNLVLDYMQRSPVAGDLMIGLLRAIDGSFRKMTQRYSRTQEQLNAVRATLERTRAALAKERNRTLAELNRG